MKVAVIGSTGVVGNVMLSLLESRNFPLSNLIPTHLCKNLQKKDAPSNKEHPLENALLLRMNSLHTRKYNDDAGLHRDTRWYSGT